MLTFLNLTKVQRSSMEKAFSFLSYVVVSNLISFAETKLLGLMSLANLTGHKYC